MPHLEAIIRVAAYLGLIVAAAIGIHPPGDELVAESVAVRPARTASASLEPRLVRHSADLRALLPRGTVVFSGVYLGESDGQGALELADGTRIRVSDRLGLSVGQPAIIRGALSWAMSEPTDHSAPPLSLSLAQVLDGAELDRSPVRDLPALNRRLGRVPGRFEGVLSQDDRDVTVTLSDGVKLPVITPLYHTKDGLISPLETSIDQVVVLHGELAQRPDGGLVVQLDHLAVCESDCALVSPGW